MRFFDLSLRQKLPLWGGFLILVTAAMLSLFFGLQALDDLKEDMLASSEARGRTLLKSLYSELLHDDVWRGYEIVTAPFRAKSGRAVCHAESIVMLDARRNVFVTSHPNTYPLSLPMRDFGADFATLDRRLQAARDDQPVIIDGEKIILALPLVADEVVLGSLVMVHPVDFYAARFKSYATRAALSTLLVLAILVPLNWYWARRMAVPLIQLAGRMGDVGKRVPEPLPAGVYPHTDELGRLFEAFNRMAGELAEKAAMEREMIQSERLAALGRLSAGIAHEINNPLGGLITAVDTMKRHGDPDPVTARVLPLLDRGLHQIADIVAALLVEARAKSRPLAPQDMEDVRTLLTDEMHKRRIHWAWHNELPAELPLPSTLVRQVVINLLLNAVQASDDGGEISTRVAAERGALLIEVSNTGRPIPPEVMKHLFEPFTGTREGGHGLGLWVTYQIVQQLHGRIEVAGDDGSTRFQVILPIEASE